MSYCGAKEYGEYCKGLSNEELCSIFQNSERKEEQDFASQELLGRFDPFLRDLVFSERYRSSRGTFEAEDLYQEGKATFLQCAKEYRQSISPVFAVYMKPRVSHDISGYYFAANDVRRKHNSKKDREGCSPLKSNIEYSLDGLEFGDKSVVCLMSKFLSFEDKIVECDELTRMWEAFASELNEREQCVIAMRYISGEKWKDIATAMGVCVKTARNIRNRAFTKLRKKMS